MATHRRLNHCALLPRVRIVTHKVVVSVASRSPACLRSAGEVRRDPPHHALMARKSLLEVRIARRTRVDPWPAVARCPRAVASRRACRQQPRWSPPPPARSLPSRCRHSPPGSAHPEGTHRCYSQLAISSAATATCACCYPRRASVLRAASVAVRAGKTALACANGPWRQAALEYNRHLRPRNKRARMFMRRCVKASRTHLLA